MGRFRCFLVNRVCDDSLHPPCFTELLLITCIRTSYSLDTVDDEFDNEANIWDYFPIYL